MKKQLLFICLSATITHDTYSMLKQSLEQKKQSEGAAYSAEILPALVPSNTRYSVIRWIEKTKEKFQALLTENNSPSNAQAIIFESQFYADGKDKGSMHFEENSGTAKKQFYTPVVLKNETKAIGLNTGILVFFAAHEHAKKTSKFTQEQTTLITKLNSECEKNANTITLDATQKKIFDSFDTAIQDNLMQAYKISFKATERFDK